ncbi:protein kinase domain-containing protein [Tepidamorphus sp. 3E244]|uniref:serine/threonine-protein kinase n=1 Tax=Tepidamorphus sp. 3E244 TaxID=3385498 RepID=UPI0038FCAB64
MRQQKDDYLTEIEQGLAVNTDPADLMRRFGELEKSGALDDPPSPRALRAKAVLQNRLGLPENAILLLTEARGREGDPEAWKTSRELATIFSWRGDVDRANTELLRAMVEASASGRQDMLPFFLADAGRVAMERGDPQTGILCFKAAIDGMPVGEREHVRAAIGHIQCLNWAEDYAAAGVFITALEPFVKARNQRLRQLFAMEKARYCAGIDDAEGLSAALRETEALLPSDPSAWEHVEYALVKFETIHAIEDDSSTPDELRDIIERLQEDQLYIQEAMVRLALADALKQEGEPDAAIGEAARALALAAKLKNQRTLYRARTLLLQLSDDAHANDPAEPDDLPLSARFVRASRIGKGGYGSVYKAVDIETGTMVAVKTIALSGISDPQVRAERLADVRKELNASRSVTSPHVARVLETFVSNDELVLVQELISGGELDESCKGRLEKPAMLRFLAQAAFGLSSLHKAGIVHRDIKPQNILLRADGTPVIVDFGLAGIAGEREDDKLRGTRDYMAPELLRSKERLFDPAADAFAFGVMLRWALDEEEGGGGWFAKKSEQAQLIDALTNAAPDRRLTDMAEAGRRLIALSEDAE